MGKLRYGEGKQPAYDYVSFKLHSWKDIKLDLLCLLCMQSSHIDLYIEISKRP